LIEEDLYFDVVFLSWTSGEDEGGGGFSYTRSVTTPGWLTISVEDTTIDGGSSLLVDVAINATGLIKGDHLAEIVILSNDPNRQEVIVPVNLFYDGPTPDIAINPDSLSMTLSGYDKGLSGSETLTISNTGDGVLNWNLKVHGEQVHFNKENYADYHLSENQDFITDRVILTRGNDEGIFNIAQESSYNEEAETPAGTEWSLMSTVESEPDDYGTWRDNAHPYRGGGLGKVVSLHLIEEGLYFDVVFHSWTSGDEGGGGFSYTRTKFTPDWLSISETNGTVDPGEQKDIEVVFNAGDLEHGEYFTGIWINSNDQDEPLVGIPAHLIVNRPHPEISIVPDMVDVSLSQYSGPLTDIQTVAITNPGDAPLDLSLITHAKTFVGEYNEKIDYADWTLAENQDSISPSCILTRGNTMGLFNIAQETQYNRYTSPIGTEWASMSTAEAGSEDYETWRDNAHPLYYSDGFNKIYSLHVIQEDLYFDVMFHSWTDRGDGGGFSYSRALPAPFWMSISKTDTTLQTGESLNLDVAFDANDLDRGHYYADIIVENNLIGKPRIVIPTHLSLDGPAPHITVTPDSLSSNLSHYTETLEETKSLTISNVGDMDLEWSINISGPPVTFNKPNYADWTLPEFQDRITDKVILTRADEEGLFNIAIENGYSEDRKIDIGESPAGTEWASMPTAEATPEDYGSWSSNAHPYRNGGIGKIVSLHLVEEDLYFDVVFHSWTSGEEEGGGGFSYTRALANPKWITAGTIAKSPEVNSTTPGGESFDVDILFDATSLIRGKYFANIKVTSNDIDMPVVDVPVNLVVEGPLPEIAVDPKPIFALWSVSTGEIDSVVTVEINNVGDDTLKWTANTFGEPHFFAKQNYANWNWPVNQDRIADSVWLTRDREEGLFNAAKESYYEEYGDNGPFGTEWASMPTWKASAEDYGSWRDKAHPYNGDGGLGKVVSLHLIEEGLYFDVVFHSWTSGEDEGGGGFSYTRTQINPSWFVASPDSAKTAGGGNTDLVIKFDPKGLNDGDHLGLITLRSNDPFKPMIEFPVHLLIGVASPKIVVEPDSISAFWSSIAGVYDTTHVVKITNTGIGRLDWSVDMPVYFSKKPFTDWTLPVNQDSISPSCILTRADNKAIFNIAQETSYTTPSPIGTKWAYGRTSDLTPEDYQNWVTAVNNDPQGMIGQTISLYVIQEDLYFDVMFHSYSGGNTGGGMSYTRIPAHPIPVKYGAPQYITASPGSGSIAMGESQEVLITFDPAMLPFGEHKAPIVIASNDKDVSALVLPTKFLVEKEVPPMDFALLGPADNEVIALTFSNTGDTLFFTWEESSDINSDEITYEIQLSEVLIPLAAVSEYMIGDTVIFVTYEDLLAVMVATGLPGISGTWDIAAISNGDTVFSKNGPYTLTIDASAVGIDEESLLPESFALHQNYPNPFNPTTAIRYDLPKQSQVMIAIYDVTGRKIRTLVSKQEEPGYRSVIWNGLNDAGSQVGTGLYIYTIRAGNYFKTRKMLLVK